MQIRAYNRMAQLARGEFLILMADDDLPPQQCDWLRNTVRLMERW